MIENCADNIRLSSKETNLISLKMIEVQKDVYSEDSSGVKKKGLNPRFKNKYAKLEDIMEFVVPILNKHGLLLSHLNMPSRYSGEAYVITKIELAGSDQWYESHTTAPPMIQVSYNKSDERITDITPQSYCGAMTYCKRYGLQSMVCIPTEDDDGESASKRPENKQKTSRPTPQKNIKYISKDQATALRDIANNNKMGKEQAKKIVHDFGHGAELYTKIPQGDYDQVAAHLEHEDLWET